MATAISVIDKWGARLDENIKPDTIPSSLVWYVWIHQVYKYVKK